MRFGFDSFPAPKLVARCFLAVWWGLFALGGAVAQADDVRVALVIGNSRYPVAPLPNATRDARAVGNVLRGMGYSVIELLDGSKEQMELAIRQTGQRLGGRKGVGVVYYAGHAFQSGWRNYMVPVDAVFSSASDVSRRTVDLQEILSAFSFAGNRVNIVVLDACRNNPFSTALETKGLAPVTAPPGTLIAYSTAPGNLAEDGDAGSSNGPYARFLTEELRKDGVRLEDVFKRVRLQVRSLTQGRQVPWESTSLEEDFYPDPRFQVLKPRDDGVARLESEFSQQFGAWSRVRDSDDPIKIKDFLMAYPSGLISEIAQFRLDQLQAVSVQPATGQDGLKHLRSGAPRYAVGDVLVINRQDNAAGKTQRVVNRVTKIEGDRVEINGGNTIVDQMGVLIKNRFGVKEPGIVWTPADIYVGKKWKAAFTNTQPDGDRNFNFWESHVVGIEPVTVPAGTFKAYKIERRGQARTPKGMVVQMTGAAWIDPATMITVRGTGTFRAGSRISEDWVDELVELRRGP